MTKKQKEDILEGIKLLLDGIAEEEHKDDIPDRCRMLTVRECSQMAEGLSEHTVRMLIKRGELPSIRTGEGRNGKILVPERALLKFINGTGGR